MSEVARQRLDKWLWFARFFKTRSLAAKIVSSGGVRINANRVTKSATAVAVGDVLTFAQGGAIRVVRVEAPGMRRGPATEAQALYTDLTPAPQPNTSATARVGARPTKKDRRALDKTRQTPLE
ncbi:MAG: RNA-binding S4 domain-containing protein [Dinoroseobacter sp.]|nr:RNA-binding S4 domain-containing protein [Dinoroseobacter sp.]